MGGCFLQAFLEAEGESQGLSGLCLRKTPIKKRAPKILPGQECSLGVTRFLFGKRKKKNHFLDTWATLQKRGPIHAPETVPCTVSASGLPENKQGRPRSRVTAPAHHAVAAETASALPPQPSQPSALEAEAWTEGHIAWALVPRPGELAVGLRLVPPLRVSLPVVWVIMPPGRAVKRHA